MPLPIIAAAGLGLQAIGFLEKAFGKSDAEKFREEQERRMAYLRKALPNLKHKAISEGLARISRQGAASLAQGRQGGARRALSLGRGADAESFIAPIEDRIAGSTIDAAGQYAERVGGQYDQALLNAETGFATDIPPIEPGVGDYAVEIGALATEYGQNQELLDILGGGGDPNQGMGGEFVPPSTPSAGEPFGGGFDTTPMPEFLEGAGSTPSFYGDIEDKRNKKERDLNSFSYRQGGRI